VFFFGPAGPDPDPADVEKNLFLAYIMLAG